MPSSTRVCRLGALALGLSLVALAPHAASASEATAAVHFADASTAFEKGEFETAAREFEAAYHEQPHPAPLYNAGLAWLRANRPDRAADVFALALSMEGLSPEQTADATERLADAERRLTPVRIAGSDAAGTASIDDGPSLPAKSRFHAQAGSHEAVLTSSAGERRTQSFSVPPGSAAEVVVTFDAPSTSESSGLTPTTIIGIAVLGGSVLFGGIAIGTGVGGLSARDDYVTALESGTSSADDVLSLRAQAVTMKITTNVMWALAGSALVAGGAVTVISLTERPSENDAKVAIGPGNVWVTVPF